ncbi:unnamed protein product, partial [Scytosiphon promiscuus]
KQERVKIGWKCINVFAPAAFGESWSCTFWRGCCSRGRCLVCLIRAWKLSAADVIKQFVACAAQRRIAPIFFGPRRGRRLRGLGVSTFFIFRHHEQFTSNNRPFSVSEGCWVAWRVKPMVQWKAMMSSLHLLDHAC